MKEKIAVAFVVTMYWLGCATLGAGLGYSAYAVSETVREYKQHKKMKMALDELTALCKAQELVQNRIDEIQTKNSEET